MEEFSLQLYYKVPNNMLNVIRKLIMIHRHCILWVRLALVLTISEAQKQFLRISRPVFPRRQWHPTPVLLPGKSHGWRSLVGCSPGVTKSQARLSDFTFTFHFHALEKETAAHSSVLSWRIPGTAEPGGLLSMGSHRVGHD